MHKKIVNIIQKNLIKIITCKIHIAEKYLSPVLMLYIRLYMGWIFFRSGQLKLGCNIFEPHTLSSCGSSWSSTLMLFKYEYSLPFLSPTFAAILATMAEILLPLLIVFGFGARLGAFGLFLITATIEIFVYPNIIEHYYWMMLFGIIILNGPGKISFDHLIKKSITV